MNRNYYWKTIQRIKEALSLTNNQQEKLKILEEEYFLFKESYSQDRNPDHDWTISWFKDQIERIRYNLNFESPIKTNITPNKANLSYHWRGTSDELSELFQKMISNNLISRNTSEADFKAIFEAKPLDEIKPINWLENAVLLAYFINKLMGSNKVFKRDSDKRWKIAESCFVEATNLKQGSERYKNNKSGLPKNHHLVDELF